MLISNPYRLKMTSLAGYTAAHPERIIGALPEAFGATNTGAAWGYNIDRIHPIGSPRLSPPFKIPAWTRCTFWFTAHSLTSYPKIGAEVTDKA
ncbi:MAG: hypothetical protein ACT4QA_14095 [Panacagrimonas sp.]